MTIRDSDNRNAKETVSVDGNLVKYHVEMEDGEHAWLINDFDKVSVYVQYDNCLTNSPAI
jgi:hypothetical protein